MNSEGPLDTRAARLLQAARRRTLLYQSEIATRAGVGQGTVSAYESGARQPTLAMLSKLLEATGFELMLDLRPLPPELDRLTGELGVAIRRNREAIVALAEARGLRDLHVTRDGAELFVDDNLATMMERRLFTTELEGLLGTRVAVTSIGPGGPERLSGWTVPLSQDQGRAERSAQ